MHWGLGPVFIYECLAGSRRWQAYAARSAGVAVLLAGIATIAASHRSVTVTSSRLWQEYAELGKSYFYAIIGVELALVMLAAPAATAGAICVDRARGTLTHMLVTDLSDPEIVLGKLAARLLPVLGLVACSWPVLAISSLLGGIDPLALTMAFAIILAVALVGCTMAMALSVWAHKPHEVVLVVYVFWMAVMLLWPIWFFLSRFRLAWSPPGWSMVANPYYLAFAPYAVPGKVRAADYLGFFAASIAASAAMAALAVRWMRPVARRGIDERRPRLADRLGIGRVWRWLPGPPLDGNPVLWREWHRTRPSPWMTALLVLVGGGTGLACLVGAVLAWRQGLDYVPGRMPAHSVAMSGAMIQLIFGLLMISATAPMSMSEERQRGSLDLLAATTLSTPTIVLGKWLGILRAVALLAIGPGLVGLALATADKTPPVPPPAIPNPNMHNYTLLSRREVLYGAGLLAASVLIHGALIASVGLALGVWVARQGRAIAMSVGFAVLIAAGWPFLVSAAGPGPVAGGLAALSPLVAFLGLSDVLLTRVVSFRENLWWVTFLDLECLALAVGVLWLTVRSFDAASGRIPERPRRVPILSDEVVVLAAMLGVGGLFGAVACTLREHRSFAYQTDIGIVATVLAVAVGIHLVAALAAGWVPPGAEADAGPGHRAFAIRWWRSFRLVPALAVGPALLVTAMAAAPLPVRVVTTITPKAGGGSTRIATQATGVTYVIETRGDGKPSLIREATAAEIAAVPHWPRGRDLAGSLPVAGAAVLTILVHGAAFVAIGAAMGIGMRRRGRAIAATVGLALLVEVAWPIAFARLGYHPGGSPDPALASAIPACVLLMFRLNRADAVEDMTGWVAYWDGMLILVGVVAAGLAVRALGRRSDAPGRAVSGIMGGAVPHLERSPRSPGGPDPWST